MRPKFFVLCAAGWLLATVNHCACAQSGGEPAPLISSGHPAGAPVTSSSGARRSPSDAEPTSTMRDNSASLRDEPTGEPAPAALGDASWTTSPVQRQMATPQLSRSMSHLSGSDEPSPETLGQQSAAPAPVQPLNSQAAPLQRVPSPGPLSPSEPPQRSLSPASTEAQSGTAYRLSGTSHLRSSVSQAQFTGGPTASVAAQGDTASVEAAGDEHRPLKPPTASDPATQEKRSSGTVQMFISVVSSLLIVVGLLLGAAWCYRKATPNLTGGLPKQVLQVLGRMPVAPRQQLILMRFGPKLVLMSNLQGEVRTLSEIIDPLEVDRICGLCESSQAGSISDSFRTVLHNIGRTG